MIILAQNISKRLFKVFNRSLFIVLLILASSLSLLSQTIVWEKEFYVYGAEGSYFFPAHIDKEGSLIVTMRLVDKPFNRSHLIKFDKTGNLLFDSLLTDTCYFEPIHITEKNDKYQIFSSVNKFPLFRLGHSSIPRIVETSKDGLVLNRIQAMDLMNDPGMNDVGYSFLINERNISYIDGKYYVPFIRSSIPNGPGSFKDAKHLIINCYDSTGKLEWRKGYDTANSSIGYDVGEKYIPDYRISYDKSILVLFNLSNQLSTLYIQYRSKIIETDLSGNVLYSKSFDFDTSQCFKSIIKDNDNNFIVLHENSYNRKNIFYSVLKLDRDGKILKEYKPGLVNSCYNLTHFDNKYMLWGSGFFDSTTNSTNNEGRLILLNKNLEVEKEFTLLYDKSNISSLLFSFRVKPINQYEFMVMGGFNKDTAYIARMRFDVTDVEDIPRQPFSLSCSPNPFKDLVEIKFDNPEGIINSINIYSVTGEKVMSLNSLRKSNALSRSIIISGSTLPAGVYFVEADIAGKIYRSWIVKE